VYLVSGFDVNQFKSDGLKFGGVRPTQFEVNIYVPTSLISTQTPRIRFFCHSTTAPPMIQDSIRVPYFGRTLKYVGDRDYPDWTVSVFNDEDFPVRNVLEDWSNRMNAAISNRMAADMFPVAYKSTALVIQYGKDGTALKGYLFEGVFPINVDSMALSWDSVNQVQSFDVTFAYDLWIPDASVTGTAGVFNPTLPA
jgi:hypothetical protein